MEIIWNNKEPIYLQLRDRLVELIMDGALNEGDALPSVRQISSEQRINPITVSKAMQILVDEELVEKKRGLGMYVVKGAKDKLNERKSLKKSGHKFPIELKGWVLLLTNFLGAAKLNRAKAIGISYD